MSNTVCKFQNLLSSPKIISSNHLCTYFFMYVVKTLLSRNFCQNFRNYVPHTVCSAQCGNCRNSLSHFYRKNFVKAMVLLKKLQKSWFDEIFFSEREFLCGFYEICEITYNLHLLICTNLHFSVFISNLNFYMYF